MYCSSWHLCFLFFTCLIWLASLGGSAVITSIWFSGGYCFWHALVGFVNLEEVKCVHSWCTCTFLYISLHYYDEWFFFYAERTERVLYRQLVCSSCRSRGQNWPWAQQNRHCMENLTNYWVTVSLARCNSHIWVRAVQFGRNWSTFIATLIETLVSWIAAQSGMTAFSGQDWIWSPAVWGCLNYESCWGLLSSIVIDSRSYMYILAFSLSVFHSLCCVVLCLTVGGYTVTALPSGWDTICWQKQMIKPVCASGCSFFI